MEKPKLIFLLICEKAFYSQDNKLSIINIFNNIIASNIPVVHPGFSIVFAISRINIKKDKFYLSIIKPSGKELYKSEELSNKKFEDFKEKMNFVLNFSSQAFEDFGLYSIKILNKEGELVEGVDSITLEVKRK